MKFIIGFLCVLAVGVQSVLAQSNGEELSQTQEWVKGIGAHTPEYRALVEAIEPPQALRPAKTGIGTMVGSFMSPINSVLYNAMFYRPPSHTQRYAPTNR